ncbi:hypothetical protein L218DRAFT_1080794 [Marasmius fiardii PR-910]|nr:hypothetical protein L218DRAFT_1080794 [Marasmius fiardii PR-910]
MEEEKLPILRPIHEIAPELLGKIFSFTVDLPAVEDPFQTPSSLHPTGMPWVLTQVCQPWRKLALGTPSLWNPVSLALSSKKASQNFLQAQAYRLNLQLHRSGDQPIDVIVSTRNLKKSMNPLLVSLCAHSHRWRTLVIELDDNDVPTLSLIRTHLPLLHRRLYECA